MRLAPLYINDEAFLPLIPISMLSVPSVGGFTF